MDDTRGRRGQVTAARYHDAVMGDHFSGESSRNPAGLRPVRDPADELRRSGFRVGDWQVEPRLNRIHGGEVERLSLSYFLSYPPPRSLNPNTPEALERITYRCLTVMDYDLPELEEDLVEFLRKE